MKHQWLFGSLIRLRNSSAPGRLVEKGMIRYLYLLLDLSDAINMKDLKPSRKMVTLELVGSSSQRSVQSCRNSVVVLVFSVLYCSPPISYSFCSFFSFLCLIHDYIIAG